MSIDLLDGDDLGFASSDQAGEQPRGVRSPRPYLIAAGIAVALGLVTFALDAVPVQVVGYLLSSVVCFLTVARARQQVVARLFSAGIAPSRGENAAAAGLLAAGLVQCVLHAWLIARHYS